MCNPVLANGATSPTTVKMTILRFSLLGHIEIHDLLFDLHHPALGLHRPAIEVTDVIIKIEASAVPLV